MTIEEYNKKLTKVTKDLQSGPGAEIMVQTAITAFTLLRGRIQEKGVDAKGQKYKSPNPGSTTYSIKSMLVGAKSFTKKSAASAFFSRENRKNLKWVTVGGSTGFSGYLSVSAGRSGTAGEGSGVHLAVLEGGYKKLRELHNYKTDHVNFIWSGRMWNDIMAKQPKKSDLLSTDADHRKGIAIIGAKEEINKKKLAGNTERFGDILDLSKSEIEQLKKSYNLGVLEIFKENGL